MHYFDTIIEINPDTGPVKYEYDKTKNLLRVDRFMPTSMHYPCNYGFVDHSLGGDGDPLDVLLYSTHSIIPGSIIKARAVGVLLTEDEKGEDAKILALPAEKIDPSLASISSIEGLPQLLLKKIEHFFQNYKSLEEGKWVKVLGWQDAKHAHDIVIRSQQSFIQNQSK